MTKPDFEFDEKAATKEMNRLGMLAEAGPTQDDMIALAKWQHSIDKAILLKLMEIIQAQNEALRKVLPEVYCLYNQVTGNRLDREKEGSVFSAYFGAKETLTKTEQMLKELEGE